MSYHARSLLDIFASRLLTEYFNLQLSEQVIPPVPPVPPVPSTVPAGIPATGALPKTGIDDPLLLLQYQQMQLLQNQQLLLRQMRTSAIAKLSQSEQWATLSPIEQNQLILQYVIQDSELPEVPIATNPFVPHLASQAATNPVMQLFTQMQQVMRQSISLHAVVYSIPVRIIVGLNVAIICDVM